MPSFCRHNRLEENCPICSKKSRVTAPKKAVAPEKTPHRNPRRPAGPRPGRGSRVKAGSSRMSVRQMERATDDGYSNELVPGLRATADALRLAQALSFSAARIEQLSSEPPGPYAQVANEADREEAAWLCFQIAYLSPLEGDEPFREIARVRTRWAGGELPDLEGVETGPRTAHEPARGTQTLEAYHAWAQKAGSQAAALAGDAALSPQRRFDQLWTRLSLPGLRRSARFEFLLLCAVFGLTEIEPWTLKYADASATSPVGLAARRVFGTGDAIELQRRSTRLMGALELPMAALDLGLWVWSGSVGGADDGVVGDAQRRVLSL